MRILIATVSIGSGHTQAAAALEEAWARDHPTDTVQRVDVLDFTSRLYRKIYSETYLSIVEHAPEIWAMVFKKTDNPELAQKLTRFRRGFTRAVNLEFIGYLRKFRPDVVLSAHYAPLEILASLKSKRLAFSPLTVSINTD